MIAGQPLEDHLEKFYTELDRLMTDVNPNCLKFQDLDYETKSKLKNFLCSWVGQLELISIKAESNSGKPITADSARQISTPAIYRTMTAIFSKISENAKLGITKVDFLCKDVSSQQIKQLELLGYEVVIINNKELVVKW